MLPTGPGRRAPFPLCPRPSSCRVSNWPPPDHPGRSAAPGATGTLAGEAAAKGAPGPPVPATKATTRSQVRAQLRWTRPRSATPLTSTTEHPNRWLPEEQPLPVYCSSLWAINTCSLRSSRSLLHRRAWVGLWGPDLGEAPPGRPSFLLIQLARLVLD